MFSSPKSPDPDKSPPRSSRFKQPKLQSSTELNYGIKNTQFTRKKVKTMGNVDSKQNNLKLIEQRVKTLKSVVRSNNLSKKVQDEIVVELIGFSNSLKLSKGHAKIDALQKVIRNLTTEILNTHPRESQLDQAAVETNSFVQVKSGKTQKIGASTLEDVEIKLNGVKNAVEIGIENNSAEQFGVYQQTLKDLVADLEMIDIKKNTSLGDRKHKLTQTAVKLFRKIEKTAKDLQRDEDMSYLKKQQVKEKTLVELENIHQGLNQVAALMTSQNDNADLKSDLAKLNQRLASVETHTDKANSLKIFLVDKIRGLYQNFGDCTSRSTNSDLQQAKANYEEIITNIANGNLRNKEEVKVKLQSLESFIRKIKDEDENSAKRRQQLLNNVQASFSSIVDQFKKDNTKVSVENLLQETESLKIKCKSVVGKIRTEHFLKENTKKIEENLQEIQNSISSGREALKNYSLAEKKDLAINQSTPNLYSYSHNKPKSKFGSSVSIDTGLQGPAIKTTAKIYNLSVPEVSNINDQSVMLRQQHLYPNMDENVFSKVEEIKKQVHHIKEKLKENDQRQNLHFINKLESYVEILKRYVVHINQVTANNAKLVLADITELLEKLSTSPKEIVQNKRISIEYKFEILMGVQEAVDELEKKIKAFEATRLDDEYSEIKENLIYYQNFVENIEVSLHYENIFNQKQTLSGRIKNMLHSLDNIVHYEDERITNTKKKMNSLKKKINEFSGPYGGVLYNTYEKNLNRLLTELELKEVNKSFCEQITMDVEKHLKILEQRSSKDQSFRRTIPNVKNEEEVKLIKAKSDILLIKKDIDTTSSDEINEFIGIKSRLDLAKLNLDQIKQLPENEERQKEHLYSEVESLKNAVEAKIAFGQQPLSQLPLKQILVRKEDLNSIEERLNKYKPEIESFVGRKSDDKFYELDENATRLILAIDKLQIPKTSEEHPRKSFLLKEIYRYCDLLEERVKDAEALLEMESSITDLDVHFNVICRRDLNDLETSINQIKYTLDKTDLNKHLKIRKEECFKKLEELLKRTAEAKKNEEDNYNKLNKKLLNIDKTMCKFQNSENELNSIYSALQKAHQLLTEFKGGEKFRMDLKQKFETLVGEYSKLQQQIEMQKNKELLIVFHKKFHKEIKPEIENFVGSSLDSKYMEMDDISTRLLQDVEKISIPQNTEAFVHKVNLLRNIYESGELLDQRAKQYEDLVQFKQFFQEAENKLNDSSLNNLEDLENNLRDVVSQLKGRQFNKSLQNEKDLYLEKISQLLEVTSAKNHRVKLQKNLSKVESDFINIKKDIDNSLRRHRSSEIENLIATLDSLRLQPNTDLYEKRSSLVEEMYTFCDQLDVTNIERNINEQLIVIRKLLDTFKGRVHEVKTIDGKLKLVISKIKGTNKLPETNKNNFIRMYDKLIKDFVKLPKVYQQNYIGSSSFKSDLDQANVSRTNIIEKLGKAIKKVEKEVQIFQDKESSDDYKALYEKIKKLDLEVDNLKLQKKHEQPLKKKIQECFYVLDKKAQDVESLESIESQLEEIGQKFDYNTIKPEETNLLDEQLLGLQVSLGKLCLKEPLTMRKNACCNRVTIYLKSLRHM